MYNYKNRLFGDFIEIWLDAEPIAAEIAVGDAYKEALRLQNIFNIFDPDSEISELNQKRRFVCSPELVNLLKRALETCRATNGLFDVSHGNLYNSRKNNLPENKHASDYNDIEIDGKEVVLNGDVYLDLGSVAKGYIVDKIVESLISSGVESGFVNGRGDIRVFGEKEQIIGIQHPRKKGEIIKEVTIKNQAIATSGDYNQYSGTYSNSHIIGNNFASVTVIADDLETADLFATVISVSRIDDIPFIIKHNNINAIIFDNMLLMREFR